MTDEQEELTQEELDLINEQEPAAEETIETTPEQPEAAQPATPAPVETPAPEMKTVPLPALQEARAEIRRLREQNQYVQSIAEQVKQEVIALKQANAPKAPSFDEDPFGATQAALAQVQRENQLRDQALINLTQQQVAQQQLADLSNKVSMAEKSFAAEHPDYYDAVSHLMKIRIGELQSFGITDPEIINAQLTAAAFQAVRTALQGGQNPAESIYRVAEIYGYKKAVAPIVPAAPAAAPAMPQRFEAIAAGQAASKSLQGGTTATPVNIQELLASDGDDFDAKWNELFKGDRG